MLSTVMENVERPRGLTHCSLFVVDLQGYGFPLTRTLTTTTTTNNNDPVGVLNLR